MDPLTPAHKYHGEQDDRYDGPMTWPGANGFPFMGDGAPSLKQAEIEALPVVGVAHNRVFDLNTEQDRIDYAWVRDRIRNGIFVRDFVERRWSTDKMYPMIYMEWTQCYVMSPKQQDLPGRQEHGSSRQFTLRRPD